MSTPTLARTPGHATAAQRASAFGLGDSCRDKPKPALGTLDRRLATIIARQPNRSSKPRWDENDAWRPGREVTFYALNGLPHTGVVWSFGARSKLRLVIPEGERRAVCVWLSDDPDPVGYETRE